MSYRTPLGRARGLGSAKHGVGHFIGQRVSGMALILLMLWTIASALSLIGADYEGVSIWVRQPLNAALASLLIAVASYHMRLGMQVVIEDYLEKPFTRTACLVLNVFVAWLVAAVGVVSILKVAFGGGGI
jgi:succinate dehydrogenase / fumarate reductase membrane anchor subunit